MKQFILGVFLVFILPPYIVLVDKGAILFGDLYSGMTIIGLIVFGGVCVASHLNQDSKQGN